MEAIENPMTKNVTEQIVPRNFSDDPNNDSGKSTKDAELIEMVNDLHAKLDHVNQNISELSSKFDKLNEGIYFRFDNYSEQISTLFNSINHSISSRFENFEKQQSMKRVSFKLDTKNSNNANNKSSDTDNSIDRIISDTNENEPKQRNRTSFLSRRSLFPPVISDLSDNPDLKRSPKSERDKEDFSNAIKCSEYYRNNLCSEEEIEDIIDASYSKIFEADSIIVPQGSQITHYYIVQSGIVDVIKEDEVISTVTSGKSLMISYLIGTLSACTFRAKTDCHIWYISIEDFRRISAYYKKKHLELKTAFLKSVSLVRAFVT